MDLYCFIIQIVAFCQVKTPIFKFILSKMQVLNAGDQEAISRCQVYL